MSKIELSPGPWSFGLTDVEMLPLIMDADGEVVCVFHGYVSTKDARMMAAAPKLYEKLKDAVDLIRQFSPGAKPDSVVDKCLADYLDALAAARGEVVVNSDKGE